MSFWECLILLLVDVIMHVIKKNESLKFAKKQTSVLLLLVYNIFTAKVLKGNNFQLFKELCI